MARSFYECPNCESDCFDDIPCMCGYDPTAESIPGVWLDYRNTRVLFLFEIDKSTDYVFKDADIPRSMTLEFKFRAVEDMQEKDAAHWQAQANKQLAVLSETHFIPLHLLRLHTRSSFLSRGFYLG